MKIRDVQPLRFDITFNDTRSVDTDGFSFGAAGNFPRTADRQRLRLDMSVCFPLPLNKRLVHSTSPDTVPLPLISTV